MITAKSITRRTAQRTMERRRSQQQRFKEQQRFSVSQQDLTDAISRMKPIQSSHDRWSTLSAASSIERLTNPPVSQLIKEFEARASLTPYASAQDLLPTNTDVSSYDNPSNSSHMSARETRSKDASNANDIIDKPVCSSISPSISDDNQMVIVEIHQRHLTDDNEHERKTQERHPTPNDDCRKQELVATQTPTPSTSMVTRSTDIDAAAAASTLGQQNAIHFDELLSKEAQLNNALADLMSLSNDTYRSYSLNSSPRSLVHHQHQRVSTPKTNRKNKSSTSASIDLLNNLLETFDLDTEAEEKKNQKQDNIEQSTAKQESNPVKPINMFRLMLADNVCANCHQIFATNEQIVNAAGQIWHTQCFVCTQCFQPFDNGIYFEHEGRKYCERDYQMLFAPCCAECRKAIIGRVIRVLQKCFHPECFRCQSCQISLLEIGFLKLNGRALCRECHAKEKVKDSNIVPQVCSTCHQVMYEKYLKYKGAFYHPHHFQCTTCRVELNEHHREVRGLLYCLPCHTKLDLPICATCRRVIDDRVISALGKQWHVEHFCCARCARPFYGNEHYEQNGLAYCESDYHSLFGSTCYICNHAITDGAFIACNKKYCVHHFACSLCDKRFNEKSKFFDVDATPVCKQCYGKLSSDVRKSIEQKKKCKLLPAKFKQTSV